MKLSIRDLGGLLVVLLGLFVFVTASPARTVADFNFDWEFSLGAEPSPLEGGEREWEQVRLPHDWSVGIGFTQEESGCSTGFVQGGIGWYRKAFEVPESAEGEHHSLVFEGAYCRSEVWLNGKKVGGRPSGYVSFVVDLTPALEFGEENVLVVRVDHSAYLDSRWYTGSGIYRNVRYVRASATRIPEWGVWVQTPEVSEEEAKLEVRTEVVSSEAGEQELEVEVEVLDKNGRAVASETSAALIEGSGEVVSSLLVAEPELWGVESPALYTARVTLRRGGQELGTYEQRFGIREARFDSEEGFLLNGERVKIKGVNLHHDAGLVGAAVPRDVWKDRLERLRSIGCNAIRMAHNPHSVELLELCDELGFLVMDEFFDEWKVEKKKSLVWLSDNKAPEEAARGYTELFEEWAERDLKATIRRDRNHPSVIMWSIGNEIEWTYPYYPQSANYKPHQPNQDLSENPPDFNPASILERMGGLHEGPDELYETAKQLVAWVKSEDPTRPVTSGLVHPSVGYATGYAKMLDVVGFNYRHWEYDGAHAMYPTWPILGSENHGTREEWEEANKRDFVAGIFVWTGYAYLGEAGPWPRKGLEISFFDFIGTKTPRGHLFEALWVDEPKVWVGTTPAEKSEHKLGENGEWHYETRVYEIPQMTWLRRWEWDFIERRWNYGEGEPLVVQAYSNCEELELFLNGESQGRLVMADCEDRIGKWMVPYAAGELKVVGYEGGEAVTSDVIETAGEVSELQVEVNRKTMQANGYDVVRVDLQLRDEKGLSVVTGERRVEFEVEGPARILGVDNGWEKSVQAYQTNELETWQGRALLLLQATKAAGTVRVVAKSGDLVSAPVEVQVED
ncbi:MAG: glycoside hydrolase family 2 TIM barrel-domain containing protein [Verrucomicrobiota bacterium]